MSSTGTKTTHGEMTEYLYDGATIEEIITSHDTHDNYNSLRVWYRGDELNLKELEIIVFQEEVEDDRLER